MLFRVGVNGMNMREYMHVLIPGVIEVEVVL